MKPLRRRAFIAATALSLFSLPALASNEFSAQLKCARGLALHPGGHGIFLEKNAKQPGAREKVGYMVEGKNAGRGGFYVIRDSEAYFVQYPKDAKQYRNKKYPNAEPETYIWAQIPQQGTTRTDHFQITLRGGRVAFWSDEVGHQSEMKTRPEAARIFKEYMVPATGTDAIGPEARSALVEALASHIDSLPDAYRSEVSASKARGLPEPTKLEYVMALDQCASVEGGVLKDKIAKAKLAIVGRVAGGAAQEGAPGQDHQSGSAR